ncbi:MAG: hypothetical protein R3F59_06715 [Myxococcota bacterium]
MLGTPAYMAPEQVRDASKVDARADVFVLGAIAYELVTGVRAFEGDDVVDTLSRVKAVRCAPVRELRPDAPAGVVEAIERALVADPEARLGSVAELVALWTREGAPRPEAGFAARVAALGASDAEGEASPAWPVADSGSQSTWHESGAPTQAPAPAVRPSGLPWWAQAGGGAALFAAGIAVAVWWTEVPEVVPAPVPAPEPVVAPVPVPEPVVAPPPVAPRPAPVAAPLPVRFAPVPAPRSRRSRRCRGRGCCRPTRSGWRRCWAPCSWT